MALVNATEAGRVIWDTHYKIGALALSQQIKHGEVTGLRLEFDTDRRDNLYYLLFNGAPL